MIKILFSCLFILLSFTSVSNAEVYDTDTIKEVDTIYWLNQQQDSAIVYARWKNFDSLKSLIDTTVLTGAANKKLANLKNADILLLLYPKQNKLLKVYITDDFITLNGQSYSANSKAITKFRAINNARVAAGELASPKVLSRVIKLNS
jgi:hypothetical protein